MSRWLLGLVLTPFCLVFALLCFGKFLLYELPCCFFDGVKEELQK
jgi:hypothetical protein